MTFDVIVLCIYFLICQNWCNFCLFILTLEMKEDIFLYIVLIYFRKSKNAVQMQEHVQFMKNILQMIECA